MRVCCTLQHTYLVVAHAGIKGLQQEHVAHWFHPATKNLSQPSAKLPSLEMLTKKSSALLPPLLPLLLAWSSPLLAHDCVQHHAGSHGASRAQTINCSVGVSCCDGMTGARGCGVVHLWQP